MMLSFSIKTTKDLKVIFCYLLYGTRKVILRNRNNFCTCHNFIFYMGIYHWLFRCNQKHITNLCFNYFVFHRWADEGAWDIMVAGLGSIFWVTFVLSVIACIIFLIVSYAISRKFYPLIYVLSIFTYVNFVAFTIDAFDLSRNWILFMLGISSVILILLGIFFSQIRKNTPKEV